MKTINTIKVVGIDYVPIKCECVITQGIGIHLVGLADEAVKCSLLRTITAMQAGGWHIPGKKIIVNFAPADLTKSGEVYDLPLALAMIAESGQAVMEHVEKMVVVGELALDGHVRGVSGAVQACRAAVEQGMGCIVPFENWPEVAELFGPDAKIFPVENLAEAIEVAQTGTGETAWEMLERDKDGSEEDVRRWRWDEIVGNEAAKRGLEIAAAGGHHVLLMGAVGTGKAGLARAMVDILPPMTHSEAMEVARLHVKLSYGNRKTTALVPSVSLIPIADCANCEHCKLGCYDIRNVCCYKGSQAQRANNSAIAHKDPERFFIEVSAACKFLKYMRWFVGGDIINYGFFEGMVRVAKENPHCEFLAFTKMWGLVQRWIDVNGELPANLHMIMSEWRGAKAYNPYNLPTSLPVWKGDLAPEGFWCPGNCAECAEKDCGCWNLKKGERVLFEAH